MSARHGRVARVAGRAMRMPAALDRRGLRWLLQALSPAPIIVLVHRGRRTGRLYRTPVEAIADDSERDEVVVSPLFGPRSAWYRNVRAGGLVEVRRDGEGRAMQWRELSGPEREAAIAAYRTEHPVYSRVILRSVAAVNGLEGDPAEAVSRELPMLALAPAREGYDRA